MPNFGWDLPPGLSHNDPHLTGEWPCSVCDGDGGDQDEDGWNTCDHCEGTGIEPE